MVSNLKKFNFHIALIFTLAGCLIFFVFKWYSVDKEKTSLEKENKQIMLMLENYKAQLENPIKHKLVNNANDSLPKIHPLASAPINDSKYKPYNELNSTSLAETNKPTAQVTYQDQVNIALISNQLQSLPTETMYSKITEGFSSEKIDYNWAADREAVFRNDFLYVDSLSEFALNNIECRSNQCKLTVATSNYEQANDLVMKLQSVLEENKKYGEQTAVVSQPDLDNYQTYLYVSDLNTLKNSLLNNKR